MLVDCYSAVGFDARNFARSAKFLAMASLAVLLKYLGLWETKKPDLILWLLFREQARLSVLTLASVFFCFLKFSFSSSRSYLHIP